MKPKLPALATKIGKMRLSGKTNTEVRDALNISEYQATSLWMLYRRRHNIAQLPRK